MTERTKAMRRLALARTRLDQVIALINRSSPGQGNAYLAHQRAYALSRAAMAYGRISERARASVPGEGKRG